jgi:hypothetical protein
MATNKKSVLDSEIEAGVLLNTDDEKILQRQATREEWDALMAEHGYIGVNHKDRVEWLQRNGYEVTRANMRDTSLATKQS